MGRILVLFDQDEDEKMGQDPFLEQTDLFTSGTQGYHTYRIPALAPTPEGTLLAFCEGRLYGGGDAGKIDLLLKRSFDGGQSWEPTQVLVAQDDMTCGNPCPVVDRRDSTIWLPFCKNLAEGPESTIIADRAPRTIWLTHSRDQGASWAEPVEITAAVKDPRWTWYATGPGHGIQLDSGRLVVPCDHIVGVDFKPSDPYHSHIVLSDDHGASWRLGGDVPEGTNECAVVQTVDGDLYINSRNYTGDKRRASAWSRDGGASFGDFRWEDELVEPICQASMARLTRAPQDDRNRVLFANPASTTRAKMRVRLSYDECRSWTAGRLLYEGPAAYSDLAVLPDKTACCLYERGRERPNEQLTLARFNAAWLEAREDPVE